MGGFIGNMIKPKTETEQMKKAGIIIGVVTGLAALAGAYILFKPKKKDEPHPAEQTSQTPTGEETVKPIVKPKVQPAGPTKPDPGFRAPTVKSVNRPHQRPALPLKKCGFTLTQMVLRCTKYQQTVYTLFGSNTQNLQKR